MRFGQCDRCGRAKMINFCTMRGVSIGEYCADCFDSVDHDAPGRVRTGVDSGRSHNDPGFDNAIRAYEEDR